MLSNSRGRLVTRKGTGVSGRERFLRSRGVENQTTGGFDWSRSDTGTATVKGSEGLKGLEGLRGPLGAERRELGPDPWTVT